jgi:hypothetical protein
MLTTNAQIFRWWSGISRMRKLVTCLETLTVYFVIAGALIGTALGAVAQFYPIF